MSGGAFSVFFCLKKKYVKDASVIFLITHIHTQEKEGDKEGEGEGEGEEEVESTNGEEEVHPISIHSLFLVFIKERNKERRHSPLSHHHHITPSHTQQRKNCKQVKKRIHSFYFLSFLDSYFSHISLPPFLNSTSLTSLYIPPTRIKNLPFLLSISFSLFLKLVLFMATYKIIHIFILVLLLPSDFGLPRGVVATLGINYGQLGDNLPQPEQVLGLLSSLKISKVRIYDTNPQILHAFANSGVDIIVTIENDMLHTLVDPQQALQWVNTHISPYFPATRITGIAVGNEVFTTNDATLIASIVPAMVSIHQALVQLGLDAYMHVSTANSLAVLANSYPPSAGSFEVNLAEVMRPLLQFLASTRAPFWINAYPYFAYKDDPSKIPLDYVLFNPNAGMVDPYTRLHYDNMLYAQVDAVTFAAARMGFGSLEVRVSETGWPSKGDQNEIGATTANAQAYNRNLLKRQMANEGTPLRPNQRLEVYLFALFNEDMKPGPTSERNYGLYEPDGTMTYNLQFSALSTNSATVSSIASSATHQAPRTGFNSLGYWVFVYLLIFQVLMRRPV